MGCMEGEVRADFVHTLSNITCLSRQLDGQSVNKSMLNDVSQLESVA